MKDKTSITAKGRKYLLPHVFKTVGLVVILLVLLITAAEIVFSVESLNGGDVTMSSVQIPMFHRLKISALYISMFLVVCSREKNEDEMISALRSETLKEIAYIAMVLWVVYKVLVVCLSPAALRGGYLDITMVIWIAYYIRFRYKIKTARNVGRRFGL